MGFGGQRSRLAEYHGCKTTHGTLVGIFCLSVAAGSFGSLAGSIGTNAMGDGPSAGEAVEQQVLEEYKKKFSTIAAIETKILKLERAADQAEMDALLGQNAEQSARREEKAKGLIAEQQGLLTKKMDEASRGLATDTRVSEGKFDALVSAFDHTVKTRLPRYLSNGNYQDGRTHVTPYDSSLRECQMKYAAADGTVPPAQAENISACTADRTSAIAFDYGFGVPAGLSLAWMLGAPYLRRRKPGSDERAEEKAPDSKTATLKIVYTKPENR